MFRYLSVGILFIHNEIPDVNVLKQDYNIIFSIQNHPQILQIMNGRRIELFDQ